MRELIHRLGSSGVEGRFVVVIGASGSGKSSLVRAGLVPALRRGDVPGSSDWLTAVMTPGPDPMAELAAAVEPIGVANLPTQHDGSSGPDENNSVESLIRAHVPPDQPLLLVVDQMEELFTQCDSDSIRNAFMRDLAQAVRRTGSQLRVVATLRADFLDRPLEQPNIGPLVKSGVVPVAAMGPAELTDVITRPAASVGVEVEPALVSQLVTDVLGQPAALPLLQFTLTELFEQRNGPTLSVDRYRSLGGVKEAVAARAESEFIALDESHRTAARPLFLRLVAFADTGPVTRRRALAGDLGNVGSEAEHIMEMYGAARLLTFDRDPATRETTVELAHESLIQLWPRLSGWIARDAEGLRVRAFVAQAAEHWIRVGEGPRRSNEGPSPRLCARAAGQRPGYLLR